MFDVVVVAIGVNADKRTMYTTDERKAFLNKTFETQIAQGRVRIDEYTGLTVDYARKIGAKHILRGLRNTIDFEYERAIAMANKQMSGVETVFLITEAEHMAVSSSIVRDVKRNGGDVRTFVPQAIADDI